MGRIGSLRKLRNFGKCVFVYLKFVILYFMAFDLFCFCNFCANVLIFSYFTFCSLVGTLLEREGRKNVLLSDIATKEFRLKSLKPKIKTIIEVSIYFF